MKAEFLDLSFIPQRNLTCLVSQGLIWGPFVKTTNGPATGNFISVLQVIINYIDPVLKASITAIMNINCINF